MVVYDSSSFPVPYSPDQGNLGDLTNQQATQLVDEAFEVWSNVSTATITMENAGHLSEDVDAGNFSQFDRSNDGVNPIVFDANGGIVDSLFGQGASDFIIGFAGSDLDPSTGFYTEGLALLNGKFTEVFTYEQFKATFVHEFGHFLGLDHTQINSAYVGDGNTANDIYIPTMYPTATDDDTPLGDLNPDDEAAVTLLYPKSDGSVESTYGAIEGTVTWDEGGPVLGANVVAMNTDYPDIMRAFSSVSDYFMQGDGAYQIWVTPGTYTLFIEPIERGFSGGSSVGPYALTPLSPSFTKRVATASYGGQVTVSAGETVSGIDFVAQPVGMCALEFALEGDYEVLTALRQLRDVMNRNAIGSSLVGLYYQHSPQLRSMLIAQPELHAACREILLRMGPAIERFSGTR
jgi:hypothetical protein